MKNVKETKNPAMKAIKKIAMKAIMMPRFKKPTTLIP